VTISDYDYFTPSPGGWNMLTRRTTAFRRELGCDDGGFSLIEVVVAMVVLMIFAGALSVTLLDSLAVSKASRQRVAAGNLAARELEITRNTFASGDAGALAIAGTNSVTNGNPLGAPGPSMVDGTPYTVQRDVQWLPTGTGVSACDGGALVSSPSLQVFVTVTWPNMRTARPVRAETLMTPLKGQTDTLATAFIAVKVQNADGTAADSVTATAAGPGGTFVHTTDASGCAVFQVGTAGTYNVTLNMLGWVDQTGTQLSVKSPIVVAAGTLATKTMTYDLAARMNVTLATDPGYSLPTTLPAINYIKLDALASLVRQTVASASTTTLVSNLWPKTDGYAAWPGGCPDSDPAIAPTSGGSRGAPVIIPPGGLGNVTAHLAAIDLTVQTSVLTGSKPVPNVVVTATNASTGASACSSADATLTLGTTNGAGKLKTSLPAGNWNLNTKWNFNLITPGPGAVNAVADPVTPLGAGVTTELFVVN
jgi:type II secretory pathway pseudopilin PulG